MADEHEPKGERKESAPSMPERETSEVTSGKEGEQPDRMLEFMDKVFRHMDRVDKWMKAKDAEGKKLSDPDDVPASHDEDETEDEDEREEEEEKEHHEKRDRRDMKRDARHDNTWSHELENNAKWREDMSTLQARADATLQCWGEQAPRWLSGESLRAYNIRLARMASKYLPKDDDLKRVRISDLHGEGLRVISNQIFDRARENSMRNDAYADHGQLRMVTKKDDVGREMRLFYGSPECTWAPFKMVPRHLVGIRRNPDDPYGR